MGYKIWIGPKKTAKGTESRAAAQAECDRANEPIEERRILALAALDWHRNQAEPLVGAAAVREPRLAFADPPIFDPIAPPMVPPPGTARPATVPSSEPMPEELLFSFLKASLWFWYCVFVVLTAPCFHVCEAASHWRPVPIVFAPVVVVLFVAPTAPRPALPAT